MNLILCLLACIMLSGTASSPVDITADHLTVDIEKNSAVFKKSVLAKTKDLIVSSSQMNVIFGSSQDELKQVIIPTLLDVSGNLKGDDYLLRASSGEYISTTKTLILNNAIGRFRKYFFSVEELIIEE